MKVIVVGEDVHNYLESYCDACGRNGYEVSKFILERKFNSEEFFSRLKDIDVVIFIDNNFRYTHIDFCILQRIKSMGIYSVCIYIDCISKMKGEQNLKYYDAIYTFSPVDLEMIKTINNNAHYLPIGADDKIYCSNDICGEKIIDVIFAGSKSKKRLLYLEKIAEYCIGHNRKMMVFGHYWHSNNIVNEFFSKIKFRFKYPNLFRFIHNTDISPKDLSCLYKKSKICINIHIEQTGEVNARTFEILGNGNFEMVDENLYLNKLGFVNNKELVIFNSVKDCIEKLEFFLMHDFERERIALTGKNIVRNEFLLSILMKRVLSNVRQN